MNKYEYIKTLIIKRPEIYKTFRNSVTVFCNNQYYKKIIQEIDLKKLELIEN